MSCTTFLDETYLRTRDLSHVKRLIACSAAALIVSTLPSRADAGEAGIPGCPTAFMTSLSNVEFMRAELGGWGIRGTSSPSPGVFRAYGGGGGGLRANCGMLLGHWVIFDSDYRLAISGYGQPNPSPDLGVELGVGFAGARWRGPAPGSFVFGAGGGAGLSRPIWLGLSASVYPMGFARFMIKPTRNTRVQLGYRLSPISTQYKFYAASVFTHDLDVSWGYKVYHFGLRGRIEDVALLRDPNRNLRSYWIGGFVGIVAL